MTVHFRMKSPGKYLPKCEKAELFCALTQSCVIEIWALSVIKKLGYEIRITGGENVETLN